MDRDSKGKFLNGHKNLMMKRVGFFWVENWGKNISSKGFCGKHYERFRIYGNPVEPTHNLGAPKKRKECICLKCGKHFQRRLSELSKGSFRFCSRECAFIFRRGLTYPEKPIEQSKWRINRKGYFETTRKRKRILQHRWIVEELILKRKLRKEEIVHHLNGIKTDNRKENLSVCTNKTHYEFIRILRDRIMELELDASNRNKGQTITG